MRWTFPSFPLLSPFIPSLSFFLSFFFPLSSISTLPHFFAPSPSSSPLFRRFVIQALRAREGDDEIGNGGKVAVTAPTGIAATNVSGVTIHSWAGVGLAKGRPQTIIDKVLKSSVACARWRQAVVLVVDEVSMLDSELFDILEATGRAVRGGQRPFGGLQIVTCGDFYQLPPVKLGEYGKGFAFQVND